MRELKIQVMRLNGELFFAIQGIYLGFLAPHDFNFKASFVVCRGEKVVRSGEVLDFSNAHRRMPGFLIRDELGVSQDIDDLVPDDFTEGDEIVVTLSEKAGPQTTDIKLGFAHAIVDISMQEEFFRISDLEDEDEREQKMSKNEQAYLRAVAEYAIPDGTILRPKIPNKK